MVEESKERVGSGHNSVSRNAYNGSYSTSPFPTVVRLAARRSPHFRRQALPQRAINIMYSIGLVYTKEVSLWEADESRCRIVAILRHEML
jgi:hypothetical protein